MTTLDNIVERSQSVLIENYGRIPLAMVRGEGSYIWDSAGKRYIDFFAGFGGAGVAGHCHPKIVAAIKQQAETLLCHGNLFTNEPQVELAERITKNAFGGKVFFCHSGAEADEAALKLVRRAAGPGRYKIITFENCFHGRTMGGLSLCPESFQEGFEPMLPGNVRVPFGDLDAVRSAIDDETAGIFVEPIQGEGGINVPAVEFMQGLREICDASGLLLVCDEVWTAPARTGRWFAYQHFGIEPDVMTLAKAVGGGAPVGVCVASDKYSDVLVPGTHGCTMGGNPLCVAAGAAAMELIEEESLVERAEKKGQALVEEIQAAGVSYFEEVRGKGLMLGIKLDEKVEAKDLFVECRDKGLQICIAKQNVVRLAPALTTSDEVFEEALEIFLEVARSH